MGAMVGDPRIAQRSADVVSGAKNVDPIQLAVFRRKPADDPIQTRVRAREEATQESLQWRTGGHEVDACKVRPELRVREQGIDGDHRTEAVAYHDHARGPCVFA